jgi:hypothetical protein
MVVLIVPIMVAVLPPRLVHTQRGDRDPAERQCRMAGMSHTGFRNRNCAKRHELIIATTLHDDATCPDISNRNESQREPMELTQVFKNRVRRVAERQGMRLRSNQRKDQFALDFGRASKPGHTGGWVDAGGAGW